MITNSFILIDSDYTFNMKNEPIIRMYGKEIDTDNDNIVLHIVGFYPYIYMGSEIDIFQFQKIVKDVGNTYVKNVEIVKRYKPIGYQNEKSDFLKITLFSPKIVNEIKSLFKEKIEEIGDSNFYEADIKFTNRFMIDYNINCFDVVKFNGLKLDNYGLMCDKLFICKVGDIRVDKGNCGAEMSYEY